MMMGLKKKNSFCKSLLITILLIFGVSGVVYTSPAIDSFTATPTEGVAPLDVTFTCVADESSIIYIWDFDGDKKGDRLTTVNTTSYTYAETGTHTPSCRVVDNANNSTTSKTIVITVYEAGSKATLTVIKEGVGAGTVTSTDGSINCGTVCTSVYDFDTEVTLKAYPENEDSIFDGWSGGGCGGTEDCAIVMTDNVEVTATFSEISPIVTLEPDIKANGSDEQVVISENGALSVTISIDGEYKSNTEADWWIAAYAHASSEWYYYEYDSKGSEWLLGLSATYSGPLFNFSIYEIFSASYSDLPQGAYTFYFAIDINANGVLDTDIFYYDSVEVIMSE